VNPEPADPQHASRQRTERARSLSQLTRFVIGPAPRIFDVSSCAGLLRKTPSRPSRSTTAPSGPSRAAAVSTAIRFAEAKIGEVERTGGHGDARLAALQRQRVAPTDAIARHMTPSAPKFERHSRRASADGAQPSHTVSRVHYGDRPSQRWCAYWKTRHRPAF